MSAGAFAAASAGVGVVQSIGGIFVSRYLAQARQERLRAQNALIESQARINERWAEIEANDALRRGDKQASDYQKKVNQVAGSQRAALAAQGIEVDSGTALELQRETGEIGALDVAQIKNNAWRQSFGFKQEALNQRFQADIAKLGIDQQISQQDYVKRVSIATGGLNAINSALQLGSAGAGSGRSSGGGGSPGGSRVSFGSTNPGAGSRGFA